MKSEPPHASSDRQLCASLTIGRHRSTGSRHDRLRCSLIACCSRLVPSMLSPRKHRTGATWSGRRLCTAPRLRPPPQRSQRRCRQPQLVSSPQRRPAVTPSSVQSQPMEDDDGDASATSGVHATRQPQPDPLSTMAAQMAKLAGSVALTFHTQLQEGQYKLLEVSEAMLQEIMASELDESTGFSRGLVEFRGANTDEAALVTSNKTYSVRLVETSNAQLLTCANPTNMFLPLEADELDAYAGAAAAAAVAASDSNPSPLKRRKLAEAAAAAAALAAASGSTSALNPDDIYVPERLLRGMVSHHYEVTEIVPRLHVLRELIMERFYQGEEEDREAEAGGEELDLTKDTHMEAEEKTGASVAAASSAAASASATAVSANPAKAAAAKFYTTADLRRLVQASDAQLFAGLKSLDALQDARGHWRLLHPDLVVRVLASLLDLLIELQLSGYDNLPVEKMAAGLEQLYEPRITKHVMRMFAKKDAPAAAAAVAAESSASAETVSFDPSRVALLRAQQLLAARDPYPHLSFLADWAASMPAGMEAAARDVSVLKGHAICETSTALETLARSAAGSLSAKPSEESALVWRSFPLPSLSPLVKTRFAQLFDRRPKWKLQDIEAYTADLCAPGQTMEQLLLQHSRPVTTEVNGQKTIVYSKK